MQILPAGSNVYLQYRIGSSADARERLRERQLSPAVGLPQSRTTATP